MSTIERIREDMKSAMRQKDSLRLGTVRMLLAELKNKEIEKRSELTDDEVLQALSSMVKKRKEAVAEAERAGRNDVAEREAAEIAVVEGYLPEALSNEELERLVGEAVSEAGASTPKDMGKVMKLLVPRVKGRADGKQLSEQVKSRLGG